MALNATITSKTGPGNTVTSLALTGYAGFTIYPDKKLLQILSSPDGSAPIRDFDLAADTTILLTISGSTYTLTVS